MDVGYQKFAISKQYFRNTDTDTEYRGISKYRNRIPNRHEKIPTPNSDTDPALARTGIVRIYDLGVCMVPRMPNLPMPVDFFLDNSHTVTSGGMAHRGRWAPEPEGPKMYVPSAFSCQRFPELLIRFVQVLLSGSLMRTRIWLKAPHI